MRVFSVIGISKSGKTTTIEEIIKELRKRGYSVGSVKEIHYEEFSIDTEGTNTDRHKNAGSQLVTARGLNETDVLFQKKLSVEEILSFYDYDFVVLEGVRDANVPNIITAHTTDEIDERIDDKTFLVSGRISCELTSYKDLKVINALTNIKDLVDEIEKHVPEYQTKESYYIVKNGEKQALNIWQNLILEKVFNGLEFDEIILKNK